VLEVEDLLAAREHAATINQAKGVIMSTMRCSPDAAFAVLVAASQRENVKLYRIAERIVAAQEEDT
jgi:AmiR/NasT family two-component response regulator